MRVIGHSRQGRPLEVQTLGSGGPVVLVIGGTHGDEPPGPALVEKLAEAFPSSGLPGTLACLPRHNPDGVVLGTRGNAAGVDLNRNFDADWSPKARHPRNNPGPGPYSEPESRALAEFIEEIRPARILTIHAPLDFIDYDGAEGLRLAALMAEHNGMKIQQVDYPTPGSLGRFCLGKGIPLVTLELPKNHPADEAWEWQREALLAFVKG
jgi:hypothetical protein